MFYFAQKSIKFIRDRNIELILKKKDESGPYWPHLMKDKKKYHWLKVDFNKWKDEDDSEDDVGQSEDLEEVQYHQSQNFDLPP
jgi:prostaglandin-E synthase